MLKVEIVGIEPTSYTEAFIYPSMQSTPFIPAECFLIS